MKRVLYTFGLWLSCLYTLVCTAQTVSGNIGGHDYVDLGLPSGNKWATCNVGANLPAERGSYFAWGETMQKDTFTYKNYKWIWSDVENKGIKFKKYVVTSKNGVVDNKTVLESEDDAANANWGGEWRMPTNEEQMELVAGCTWEWVDDFNGSGLPGRVGTSKKNGATIFLPVTGSYEEKLRGEQQAGFYWSASQTAAGREFAYCITFYNERLTENNSYLRSRGHAVRAVAK